jgi:hypothetical protein
VRIANLCNGGKAKSIVGCDNESITPILVDPDENEYFCSDIQTSPDDTSTLSTWSVTKFILLISNAHLNI